MSTPASYAANNGITLVPVINHDEVFDSVGKFKAVLSSTTYTPTVIPTTNYNSNGNILTFSINTNNKQTAFHRQIYMKFYWDLVFTGTAGTLGLMCAAGIFDAPRAYPALQCCNTMTVTLGNSNTGFNLNQVLNAFLNCNTDYDDLSKKTGLCPTMTDTTQNYNDVFAYGTSATATTPMLGTNWSPLTTYGLGMGEMYEPRGSWPINVLTNTSTSAHVRFTTIEPVMVPPIGLFAKTLPLLNLDYYTIMMSMGNLNRCWSHIPGVGSTTAYTSNGLDQNINSSAITSLVATWYQSPEVHTTYITPGPQTVPPPLTIYPYTTVDMWPNTGQSTLAPSATSTVTIGAITLAVNPSRIYIWVANDQSQWDFNSSDSFHRITNISVNFDNTSGQLASASEEDLIQFSIDNGWRGNQVEWVSGKGSILILDIGKQIPLKSLGEVPGTDTKKTFQYTITYQNINQAITTQPVIWTVVMTPGLCTINNGFTTFQKSICSVNDVLNAINSSSPSVNSEFEDFYGGSLGSMLHGANKWMQKHKIGTRLISAAETHMPGFTMHPAYGAVKAANQFLGYGGIQDKQISKRKRVVGGVPLSKEELRQFQ